MFNTQIFGQTIKRLRIERKLSLQTFADMCDLSIHTIRSYQFSRQVPSTKAILKICSALSITPNELLEGIFSTPTELDDVAFFSAHMDTIPAHRKANVERSLDIILDCMNESIPRLEQADFGTRLRVFRQDAGFTVQDFATHCNMKSGTLITMEANQGLPGSEVLLLLCKELHISPDFLLFGAFRCPPLSEQWYCNLTPRQISSIAKLVQYL